ncbi:MAG TPA: DMT family transporter [Polyangia bacterium]|jgi:drug/metabolite transporter (DMT)-like permease|nr:DMT family transporter [Polyangia bacterium]
MNAPAPHPAHYPTTGGIPNPRGPHSATDPDTDLHRGRLLLVVSSILFGIMAILAKHAAHEVSGPQVAFVRFVVCTAGCGLYATWRPLRIQNRTGVVLRGLLGGLAVLCYFLAIWKLPVGMATLLNYTAPVFTAVLAAMFLSEPLTASMIGALIVTLVGVCLVITGSVAVSGGGIGPWHIVGMMAAVLSGGAVTAIRWARRSDGAWELFSSFSAIGLLVCAPLTIRWWEWPSSTGWALLVALGAVSLAAQLLFTYALRYTSAALAGVISQLTPVSAMLLGLALYHEPYGWKGFLGAVVTLLGVVWGAYSADRGVAPKRHR